jgi:hypothetical protein
VSNICIQTCGDVSSILHSKLLAKLVCILVGLGRGPAGLSATCGDICHVLMRWRCSFVYHTRELIVLMNKANDYPAHTCLLIRTSASVTDITYVMECGVTSSKLKYYMRHLLYTVLL